jgi:hypothetical protein
MIIAPAKAKSASIHAVVTRADGTVEDLGVIAYTHKDPLKNALGNLGVWFRTKLRGARRHG